MASNLKPTKYSPIPGTRQRWDESTDNRPLNQDTLFYLWAVVAKPVPVYGQPLTVLGVYGTREKAAEHMQPGKHALVIIEIQ